MTRSLRLSFGCLLALLALAPAVSADEGRRISVEFRGSLKDGLREIATAGGLNLVATGELAQPAEIYLKDVSADEALATVSAAYHLKVFRQGSIWTLRPMTADEIAAVTGSAPGAAPRPADSAAAPSAPATPAPPVPPLPAVAPIALLPPIPPLPDAAPSAGNSAEREARHKILEKLKSKRGKRGGKHLVDTGPVEVEEGEVVDSAVSYGSSVTVKGGAVVEEDVVAFGGDVVLEPGAVVEGDAVAFGGNVRKDEGAIVEGQIVSFGGLGAVVAKGVTLSARRGADHADRGEDAGENRSRRHSVGIDLTSFILRFAMLFGLGFLALMFAPARMQLIEGELKREPIKCGVTGLLGSIVLVVLTILMVGTIIGIPAALALWMVVGVGVAMGLAAVASELGLRLPVFRHRKSQAAVLAAGLLALMLFAKIPVIGSITVVLVGFVALGAIIRTRFGQPTKGMPQPDTAP